MNELLNEVDYVKSTTVLSKIPRLTKRQLDYWARAGYVACWNPTPGRGTGHERLFHREELVHIKYMDILVNQLKFEPRKAVEVAIEAAKCLVVKKGYTWVELHGIIIGLPLVEELQ